MNPGDPAPVPAGRLSRSTAVAGLALLVVAGLAAAVSWICLRPKPPAPDPEQGRAEDGFPPDPRLAYRGPFRNVRPDVKYVGDEKCIDCHKDIHRTYRRHPMGRASAPTARLADK